MSLAESTEPAFRIDPLIATVGDRAELLNSKRITSVELVELYISIRSRGAIMVVCVSMPAYSRL